MTASTLLAHLADLGVRLAADAGSLTVEAPRGVLTAEDRAALQACKPELVALVSAPSAVSYDTAESTGTIPDHDPGPAWPASWHNDFESLKAKNERLGYSPGNAARLAYQVLKARASAPWRALVAAMSPDFRQRWGDRAGELQDFGVDWREAERLAFDEITSSSESL